VPERVHNLIGIEVPSVFSHKAQVVQCFLSFGVGFHGG